MQALMFSLGVNCVLGANKNETAVQEQLQHENPLSPPPPALTLSHTHSIVCFFIGLIMEH